MAISNPKAFTKNTFKQTGITWTDYYKNNKFEAYEEVETALKYIPVYYQKKNRMAAAAAYALWNGVNQRFEIFCPASPIFRSANLHELGHIYFGHLRNSRKYIVMAKKLIGEHEYAIRQKFGFGNYSDIYHDVINICMDFEINSKLFRTPKEREELNASVQFYLMRQRRDIKTYISSSFDPEALSKKTVIYFPEDFGLPGKKSFLEYVIMICDIAEDKFDFSRSSDDDGENSSNESNNSSTSLVLPSNKKNNENQNNSKSESLPSNEDASDNKTESETPSFGKSDDVSEAEADTEGFSDDDDDTENDVSSKDDAANDKGSNGKSSSENKSSENESSKEDDISPKDMSKMTKEERDNDLREKMQKNVETNNDSENIRKSDSHIGRGRNSKDLYEDLNGGNIESEIHNAEHYEEYRLREEREIETMSEKIDVCSSATEITSFIMKNALPSITSNNYNDIMYNYNRGRTKDVFVNKVRTNTTFKKPCINVLTDVSGSMDAEYTKSVVKALKTISSRIDNRSSITFYNYYMLNKEKLATLSDEIITKSFVGGGTRIKNTLREYIKSSENNSANTLIIISDFEDYMEEIKKCFDQIKSRIICIEVNQPAYRSELLNGIEEYEIKNVRTLKVVDRKFAA